MKPLEIKHHPDGMRYARPYLGTNAVTGAPMRPYKRFPDAESDEEALAQAREWLSRRSGAAAMGLSPKVGEMLAQYIRTGASDGRFSASTERTYLSALTSYVEPIIGELDVSEVTPAMVTGMYSVLAMGADGREPISPSTLRKLHFFLSGAWRWMVSIGIAEGSPIDAIKAPTASGSESIALCEAEFATVAAALNEALQDGVGTVFRRNAVFAAWLALYTGVRVGEACGLLVGNVSVSRRKLHVGGTVIEASGGKPYRQDHCKTKRSTRNIALSEDAAEGIRRHLEWQKSYMAKRQWSDPKRPLCCCKGKDFMRPSRVSAEFSALRDSAGLPKKMSFHGLRHTHATWLIANGVDMRTVQERLGHASVAVTLGIYSHVLPGRDQAAADAFDAVMREVCDGWE